MNKENDDAASDLFNQSNAGEGLYDKYRVYHADAIPADWERSDELADARVDGFVFVLRPDHDYHARVALAAYMESVRGYNPQLADDISGALDLMDVPKMKIPD